MRCFAANVLYQKVRKSWSEVPPDAREQLALALLGLVRTARGAVTSPLAPQLLERVGLVLASAALQSRDGLNGFVAEALALGAAAFADGAPGGAPRRVAALASAQAALAMLRSMPRAVEEVDFAKARRDELRAELQGAAGEICRFAEALLAPGHGGPNVALRAAPWPGASSACLLYTSPSPRD